MNKNIISLFICCVIPFFLLAQQDTHSSIFTEDGIFTVSRTSDGKDMISFDVHLWDDMVKGTKYISENLVLLQPKIICIEIANKKQRHCKAGIGFRCGIFDCLNKIRARAAMVNNTNRICSAMIQKRDACTIKVIFLDKVDWLSLQNDQ